MKNSLRLAAASLFALGILAGHGSSSPTGEAKIRVPKGFVVERVAGPPLVERPIMAGFDEQGRLYVADSAGVNARIDALVKNPPHRIVRLEDTDGDGVFDKSIVFAEKITFPMGALWHDGALYVCAPPSLWRFRDTDGDGRADERKEIVAKFGSNGNAASIHGPALGPDGRLYWADGRHGHEITRPDGTTMKGKAARIFRCKPDGSEVEVVCGGGMDNPVEVAFTPEGEAFATVAILHGRPKRIDAIIHCIEGGVFPYHNVVQEFKKTGDLLPAMIDVGWVAPSGLMRYRSRAFGKEYRGNLFSSNFNTHNVQRHVIERDGGTFRGKSEDFLVCDDPDFHPTDLLEDADGSLLVLDTGGWFRQGCPTSRIAKPQIKGAIYRVRRKGAPAVKDPWGTKIDWKKPSPKLLDDDRFAVRDRAIRELASHNPTEACTSDRPMSVRARRNGVWTLTRSESPKARHAVRGFLTDKDASVRNAAAHSAGLHRDKGAREGLMRLVRTDESPAVRRSAAAALGRIGDAAAVPALLDGLRPGTDRFLEHSLLYSLIVIGNAGAVREALEDESPRVRRGALIALDQMDGGDLSRTEVARQLGTSDRDLRDTALGIVMNHAWANELLGLIRTRLAAEKLDEAGREELRGLVAAFAEDAAIQDLVAQTLRRKKTSSDIRLALLEMMAQAPLDRLPATWAGELRWALDAREERIVRQAVASIRAAGIVDFDAVLLRIARDKKGSTDLRAEALAAAAPRRPELDNELFAFLGSCMGRDKPVLLRLTAAQAMGGARLNRDMLRKLISLIANAGPLELPKLLGPFEFTRHRDIGKRLVAALEKSPGFESVSAEALRRALRNFPGDVTELSAGLFKRLEVDTAKQEARLAELKPALSGGDADRGRTVFFGRKAACIACHAVQRRGARVGPDLSKIGSIRTPKDLLEAIVFPSASFVRGYEPTVIRTKDGDIHDGLIARETAEAIHLFTTERIERRISRSSVDAIRQSKLSIMPQGMDRQLSPEELRDLIAFLGSLR